MQRNRKKGSGARFDRRVRGNATVRRTRHRPSAGRSAWRPSLGQQLTLEIGSLTVEGEAVARHDGYVLFVSGAVPGERAVIEVISAGPRYGRARVVRVIHRAAARVEPRCRHFGQCGGCAWQHIDYAEQLRWKERLLRSTLEHQLKDVHLPIQPIIGMDDPWGTRHKVHFLVGRSNQNIAIGHYRAHSRDFVPVVECPVHHASGNEIARAAVDLLQRHGVKPYIDGRHGGDARHLVVRVGRSGTAAQMTLVATGTKFAGAPQLGSELLQKQPSVTGVFVNVSRQPGSAVFGSFTQKLAGVDRMVEEITGVQFLISPTVFFQTNAKGAALLADIVMRYTPAISAHSVLDLYAGVGLFSAPLARRGHRVLAVEENPVAVADGIATLKHNRISGCRFVAGKVESVVKKLAGRENFQVVILDPPREGCPEWALRKIARHIRPQRIIDVSCDAAALARDLAILGSQGYRTMEIQPIDMFPHTAHIESVAWLELSG